MKNQSIFREAFFHEDDCRMQQLLPLQNQFQCRKQMKDIDEFSKEHYDETSESWNDIYAIQREFVPLISLKLSLNNLVNICEKCFKRYDIVKTGGFDPAERIRCSNVIAFGTPGGFTVFLDHNEAGYLKDIWFDILIVNESELSQIKEWFKAVAKMQDLLFVDWTWNKLFSLCDRQALDNYLNLRLKNQDL